ncbi:MAG: ABC transporter ATP-binding protein [Trueperaceae bacterium]|nr:ABC transporter ATP-binding protein [Trueperaceae bacterium]
MTEASATPARSDATPLLDMHGITKRFPGVIANDRVSLSVYPGEVHALLGENGAGKTTLISILYGLYQPDDGTMAIRGEPVRFYSPKDAMRAGVGLVAQHFMLARRHTVAENIALGLEPTPWWRPTRRLRHDIRDLGERYGLSVDPDATVAQLSAGEQQRVEILKALVRGADLLILDEPTSVLTPQEAERLFDVVARMRREGKAVIFITHKLGEVMAVADHITVLRRGAVVGSVSKHEASPAQLAQLMVGRAVEAARVTPRHDEREVILEVREVRATNRRGNEALKGTTLQLRQGEILGVAGVAGNGQSELIEVLTGMRQPTSGSISLDGRDVTAYNARQLFEAGVAHIPEDRNHTGVVPSLSVEENLVLRQYRYAPYTRNGLLDARAVAAFAKVSIEAYDIATPSPQTTTSLLSGGNVQKLILARELSGEPQLIVAAHPTYGLDVSATELTHRALIAQRDRGAGVLLVSEDLDELLQLCDRIAVIFNGHIMATLPADEATHERLGMLMAGMTDERTETAETEEGVVA